MRKGDSYTLKMVAKIKSIILTSCSLKMFNQTWLLGFHFHWPVWQKIPHTGHKQGQLTVTMPSFYYLQ